MLKCGDVDAAMQGAERSVKDARYSVASQVGGERGRGMERGVCGIDGVRNRLRYWGRVAAGGREERQGRALQRCFAGVVERGGTCGGDGVEVGIGWGGGCADPFLHPAPPAIPLLHGEAGLKPSLIKSSYTLLGFTPLSSHT